MNRFLLALLAPLLLSAPRSLQAQDRGAAALGELVSGLGVSVRVLMIGAHPDDEDTPLIAWLARGRHADVAYLSLTRGDGGQNLIGNELGEALGVIRTEELLAARRIDGGTQYFTRAYDFGFSKTAEETLEHWDRDSILGDVVRVVRMVRPHIIVPVFSGTPRDGHGHHQVAGILGREVFDAAMDTVRFPVRAFGDAWTPLKLYGSRRFAPDQATLRINVGEYSPLLGRTYAEIAAESRSQHRSQGFGAIQRKGVVWSYVARERSRVNESTPASQERSIFEGMDTTLSRLKAGSAPARTTGRAGRSSTPALQARVNGAIDSLVAATRDAGRTVDLLQPAAMIPALARVVHWIGQVAHPDCAATANCGETDKTTGGGRAAVQGTPRDELTADQRASLEALHDRAERALLLAAGLDAEAFVGRETLAPGDTMSFAFTVYNQGRVPSAVSHWSIGGSGLTTPGAMRQPMPLMPDSALSHIGMLEARNEPTQPRWLRSPRAGDQFEPSCIDQRCASRRVDDVLLAVPEAPPVATASVRVGERAWLTVETPVVNRRGDPVLGDVRRRLQVVPAIAVTLDREVEYAPANAEFDRTIAVHLRPGGPARREARVSLRLPRGLAADSATRMAVLEGGRPATVSFRVRGRLTPGRHAISAIAESDGVAYTTGYISLEYEHITPQRLYREATIGIEAVDIVVPPGLRRIAYIPGVGDNVAPMLAQLGLAVTVVDPAELGATNFSTYDAVVVGTRANESRPEQVAANARLLEYVRNGGTMVVQYGQYEMQQPGIMPYPIVLSRPQQRVTLENAPVRVLRPEHRLLNTPNRITERDFQGWVQERSLYMPVEFDESYTPLLAMNDPGEEPNEGAILIAPYGRGTYVYTTLSLFRQLPAGVPGPARLIVNMLAARAEASSGTRGRVVP